LAGQLASLLYSSTKTASSSLLPLPLEQDKPKTLHGMLQPTIHKRRKNLSISCILPFESSITCFIWLNALRCVFTSLVLN